MPTASLSLKWCRRNLERQSQAVLDLLHEEYPDVEMEVVDCVGKEHCGLCTDVPFAMRNGAFINARDARGLYARLKQGMDFAQKPVLPGTYADVMAGTAEASAAGDSLPPDNSSN